MGTQSSKARTEQRESQWRDRMQRHAASGQSVAEFCRSESVSDASFYLWRARLRARDGDRQQAHSVSAMPGAFIDLGPMPNVRKNWLSKSAGISGIVPSTVPSFFFLRGIHGPLNCRHDMPYTQNL
jgi:hypothetical protein